jgi:hypothetical protein
MSQLSLDFLSAKVAGAGDHGEPSSPMRAHFAGRGTGRTGDRHAAEDPATGAAPRDTLPCGSARDAVDGHPPDGLVENGVMSPCPNPRVDGRTRAAPVDMGLDRAMPPEPVAGR